MPVDLNVFLVDDSERIISLLKTTLSSIKGVKIVGYALRLQQAEEMINNHEIDVITLDIQFPEGNGLDFLKWIKPAHPQVLVIMLSNSAGAWHRAAALTAGADYFFDKSMEFEQVGIVLSELLHNKRGIAEN